MNPVIFIREGNLLKDYPFQSITLYESVIVRILRKESCPDGTYNFKPDDLKFPYDSDKELIWCLNPMDDYISIGTVKDFVNDYMQANLNKE